MAHDTISQKNSEDFEQRAFLLAPYKTPPATEIDKGVWGDLFTHREVPDEIMATWGEGALTRMR